MDNKSAESLAIAKTVWSWLDLELTNDNNYIRVVGNNQGAYISLDLQQLYVADWGNTLPYYSVVVWYVARI